MAARLIELKGSLDFTKGPSGTDGKGVALVVDAANQDEAYAVAIAFFPPIVAGIPRGSITVKEECADVYAIDVDYRNAVPTENSPTAGNSPADARPPAAGGNNAALISRDMTFSTGGGTRRIYRSIKTRHRVAKGGDIAPDYGKLIGVQKDGKVEGCEVVAPTADFTITKRFLSLTFGWFRNMLDLIAHTNDGPWLGMERGEVLFKGSDGNFKDGDPYPWTVTGKFGYSKNLNMEDDPDELTLGVGADAFTIPDVMGWEYVWVRFRPIEKEVVIDGKNVKVPIEIPRWAFVEQVYSEGNLSNLGMDA